MSDVYSASRIAGDVAAGRRKAGDVCNEALGRIGAVDPQLGAFLGVTREHALRHAEQVDAAVAAGRLVGPLAGVPTSRNRKTWPCRNTTQPIESTPRSSPSPGDRVVVVTSTRPTAPGATGTTLVTRVRPGDEC
ncbi:MAG TPA: amidase family protein [Phycisphaerae bacterium]|nr:amidase family protein [Phycisphaerae bacterium]